MVIYSSLSLPPQLSRSGLDKGDVVAEHLDEGHNGHLVEDQSVVAGGGQDDPLSGGDVPVSISPTPVVSLQPGQR